MSLSRSAALRRSTTDSGPASCWRAFLFVFAVMLVLSGILKIGAPLPAVHAARWTGLSPGRLRGLVDVLSIAEVGIGSLLLLGFRWTKGPRKHESPIPDKRLSRERSAVSGADTMSRVGSCFRAGPWVLVVAATLASLLLLGHGASMFLGSSSSCGCFGTLRVPAPIVFFVLASGLVASLVLRASARPVRASVVRRSILAAVLAGALLGVALRSDIR